MPQVRYGLDDFREAVDFRQHFAGRADCEEREGRNYLSIPHDEHDRPDSNWHGAVYKDGVSCHKCHIEWSPFQWLTEQEGLTKAAAFDVLRGLVVGEITPAGARPRRTRAQALAEETAEHLGALAREAAEALDESGRAWWHGRGVSDCAIERFQLGVRGPWATIPATTGGKVFALKKRWRSTNPHPKGWRYIAETGSRSRFAPWVLPSSFYDPVTVIVGGEIKALVLWSHLQERGIEWSVATTVGGEGTWGEEWSAYIKSPLVAIWPDKDPPGTPKEDCVGAHYVTRVRASLGRAKLIVPPPTHGDAFCKDAVDDYLLAGGDPIPLIRKAVNL